MAKRTAPKGKTIQSVAFVSLGCPKNLVDSERMLGLLAGDGLSVTSDADWQHGLRLYQAYDRDAGARDIRDTVNAVRKLPEGDVCGPRSRRHPRH